MPVFLTCKYFCMGSSTKVAAVPFLLPTPPSIYSPTPRDRVLQRGREGRRASRRRRRIFSFFQTPLPALFCRLRTFPKLPHAADSYDRRRRRRRLLCLCPMHGNGGGATAGEEEERLMRQDPPLPLFPPPLPPQGGNCGSDTLRW